MCNEAVIQLNNFLIPLYALAWMHLKTLFFVLLLKVYTLKCRGLRVKFVEYKLLNAVVVNMVCS